MRIPAVITRLAIAAALGVLQGCGGGGGDDSPPPPPPPPQPTFAVGGAANGLSGTGLVLTLNGGSDLAVGASGIFTFSTQLASGTAYTVAVRTQPSSPSQTCTVANFSGTVGGGPVTNVSVSCTTNNYSVGGVVQGLTATGLVLQLNGTLDLPVSADGSFTFPGTFDSGSNFSVTVIAQPTGPFQTCVVTNASGVIGGGDVSVPVSCTTDMFSVGGTVTGLTGSGLVLQLNGGQDLPIGSNGAFEFPDELLRGSQYNVTIRSQSSTFRELCGAGNARGTGTTGSITTVTISCAVVGGFVYGIWDTIDFGDPLYGYGFDAVTGALLPLGTVAGLGRFTPDMEVSTSGSTLYAIDFETDTVNAFAVDRDKGRLTRAGDAFDSGVPAPFRMGIHPSGEFLFVQDRSTTSISLLTIDPATGQLTLQGEAAPGVVDTYVSGLDIAISPDGAFLYRLAKVDSAPQTSGCNCTPSQLTTYSIDADSGALTELSTITLGDLDGLSLDPENRFLYVRDIDQSSPFSTRTTTIYPFSLDPDSGALSPVGVDTTVINHGDQMVIDPTGRFAYLAGYRGDVDAFSIDPSSGALTAIGERTGFEGQIASDSSGRFIFAAVTRFTEPPPNPDSAWRTGSTLQITQSGSTAGQLSEPAPGSAGITGAGIVVVE
jgi:6-phosphogluconolactonase (cycloisomerase 2 family)